jgi:hypothetical protein
MFELGCAILCSFDRTSTSFVNTPRSINDSNSIQLDRTTETALLWSSGGIKSILMNQWKSTMNENESVLINTFTGKNKILFIITNKIKSF